MRGLLLTLWLTAAVAIVVMVVHPTLGVAWGSPAATVAIGLVGLGLCVHARERASQAASELADADDLPRGRY